MIWALIIFLGLVAILACWVGFNALRITWCQRHHQAYHKLVPVSYSGIYATQCSKCGADFFWHR